MTGFALPFLVVPLAGFVVLALLCQRGDPVPNGYGPPRAAR